VQQRLEPLGLALCDVNASAASRRSLCTHTRKIRYLFRKKEKEKGITNFQKIIIKILKDVHLSEGRHGVVVVGERKRRIRQ
jgi:hypothetical protein